MTFASILILTHNAPVIYLHALHQCLGSKQNRLLSQFHISVDLACISQASVITSTQSFICPLLA
jgi:hypothetical protein